jgi:hypothetical protein
VPISPYANRTISRPTSRKRPWLRPIVVIALISLSLLAGWLGLQVQVQNELRNNLQASLNELFRGSLLVGKIVKAEFVCDEGIRLYDVDLSLHADHLDKTGLTSQSEPASPLVHIEIYEAFLEIPVSLPELLTGSRTPQSVQIRRAKIRLQQNEHGDWNIGKLVEQVSKLKPACAERIPLDFRDCTIEFVSDNPQLPSLTFSDVVLSVRQLELQGIPLIQVQGEFNGREVSGTQFTILLDERQQIWQASFNVPQLRISPNILTLLPTTVRHQLSNWPQIEGSINCSGQANGDFAFRSPAQVSCSGQLFGFSCEDPKLPLPIRQTSLEFVVSNDELKVSNARGKLGEGTFRFDFTQAGLENPSSWKASGRLDRFNFDHFERFLPWLPNSFAALNEKYSPGGLVDMQFELGDSEQGKVRSLQARLINASFNLQTFPYLVENCTGEANWIGDECQLHIRSINGSQTIQIDGRVQRPGPESTFQLDISVPHGLPFDEKLQTAMNATPNLKRLINDFNPTGKFSLLGRIERATSTSRIIHAYDVRLNQCTIKHNRFDYPIYNIHGLVQVRDQTYAFVDISGTNSGATIVANGSFQPAEGLDVKFFCRSVPLDNQVRNALNPELRKIWTGFRPSGTLDLARLRMTKKPLEEAISVSMEASMNKPVAGNEPYAVSIKPVWFPYEMQQLSGNVKIGNGKIELTDINGRHGRTWFACFGEGEYGQDDWWLKFKNLLVGSLQVDEDLLAAVPKSLTSPLRKLSYTGLLNVHGEVTLAGTNRGSIGIAGGREDAVNVGNADRFGSASSLAWDLRFDMNQAKMQVGMPLENVFGSVQLRGEYDGRRVECLGEMAIDSLTIYGMQITKLNGPILLNGERAAVGAFATSAKVNTLNTDFSPMGNPNLTTRSLTGELYDGLLKLDAQIASDPTGEFYLQTTLADACLNQLCKENATKLSDVKGRSFAAFRLVGNSLGTHSYRGDGRVQLRQAEIFHLPLMLAVIKSMRVGTKSQIAFDSSNIDFRIVGQDIEFTRIEMLGTPVSLLGNGKANFNREIELNFYSVMGKNRFNIPILSDLYRASSQQVLWIQVDGTIDSPQTRRNVLPQINDSLKQLFQPVDPLNIARQ